MENSHLLFESVFKRTVSASDTSDYLLEVTEQYPYFTAAQFYLLQQTPVSSDRYKNQAGKTSLLFNNPFWLNYQLEQDASKDEKTEINSEILGNHSEEELPLLAETPVINEPVIPVTPNIPSTDITNLSDEHAEGLQIEEKVTLNANNLPLTANGQVNEEEAGTFSNQNIAGVIANNGHEQSFLSDLPSSNKTNGLDEYDEEETELADETEIEPMNIRLNFTPDIATLEETISFEPLHTSDYFASLGIKLNEDGKPVDKLGRQLKSFTEWLKTMKKIHIEQLEATTEQTDIIIQKMAEKSNTEGDVLTEAMAEVLVHQGKRRKAIEVYQKLSLLNPAKSAYFAAKIEQIAR